MNKVIAKFVLFCYTIEASNGLFDEVFRFLKVQMHETYFNNSMLNAQLLKLITRLNYMAFNDSDFIVIIDSMGKRTGYKKDLID